jgi:hypothetical protein
VHQYDEDVLDLDEIIKIRQRQTVRAAARTESD